MRYNDGNERAVALYERSGVGIHSLRSGGVWGRVPLKKKG